ncbi:MAG: hypothetical protein LKE85_12145 [Lachnospiraceae bacterium]|jgi:hypothetical protein|nr:hypothetical protein [Lachnospiraceae bacterium]
MNESIFTALAGIFSGKGGGLKLAIVCIAALGLASVVTDNDYEMDARTAKGGRFKMKPHRSSEDEAPEEEEDGGDPDPDPAVAGEPV